MRGLANENKRRKIFNFYRPRADIILIQESHSEANTISIWKNEWGGQILASHGETNSKGVIVLVCPKFEGVVKMTETDQQGRWQRIDVEISEI